MKGEGPGEDSTFVLSVQSVDGGLGEGEGSKGVSLFSTTTG